MNVNDALQSYFAALYQTNAHVGGVSLQQLIQQRVGFRAYHEAKEFFRNLPDQYTLQGDVVLPLNTVFHPVHETAVPPVDGTPAPFQCIVCSVRSHTPDEFDQHLRGISHKQKLDVCSLDTITQAAKAAEAGDLSCQICSRTFQNEGALRSHLASNAHELRVLYMRMMASQREAGNRAAETIHVSTWQATQAVQPGQAVQQTLTITNISGQEQRLQKLELLRAMPEVTLSDAHGCSQTPPRAEVSMQPNDKYDVTITVQSSYMGLVKACLLVHFEGIDVVPRPILVKFETHDPNAPSLAPTAPFKPRSKNRKRRAPQKSIPGVPPPKTFIQPYERPLVNPKLSQSVVKMIKSNQWSRIQGMLQEPVNSMQDMAKRMQVLVWLEEHEQMLQINDYDMDEAQLMKQGEYITLEVPGLAEGRPSVLRGDPLFVRRVGSNGPEYQGYVHNVLRDQVLLKFNRKFQDSVSQAELYSVRFKFNNNVFRLLKEAVHRFSEGLLQPLTFIPGGRIAAAAVPSLPAALTAPTATITWKNTFLNREQKLAVSEVLRGKHVPLPYLIFGPPGTGKTSTVVEAVIQVLTHQPSAHILLCAPSNGATDLLAERLLAQGCPKAELIRLQAYSRSSGEIPAPVMDISNWDATARAFVMPDRKAMMAKRVVLTTTCTAGKLYHFGIEVDHFSHIIVDEAGQAEEPLLLCALAGLATERTHVVLAGDPRQLGPVIFSSKAASQGMEVSTMERLTETPPYRREGATLPTGCSPALESVLRILGVPPAKDQEPAGRLGPFFGTVITKLVSNYRSHTDILRIPSQLFYDSELQQKAHASISDSMLGWEQLPNPRFPVVFHAVIGEDERESSSPSWFNQLEAKQVAEYVEQLLRKKLNPVQPAEIGVITPYRKQVQKIRSLLNAKVGKDQVKVGSVESFQGQERRVIIISTVRSTTDFIPLDEKHHLGFLDNPKRFNVALTRAQAGMIIVGNPEVLQHNRCWRDMMRFIQSKGGWRGTPFDLSEWDAEDVNGAQPSSSAGSRAAAGSNGVHGRANKVVQDIITKLRPKDGTEGEKVVYQGLAR